MSKLLLLSAVDWRQTVIGNVLQLIHSFVNREELLLLYLAYQGPLIASINGLPLEFYDDDIVERNCDSENLNHVVQIVGYDMS